MMNYDPYYQNPYPYGHPYNRCPCTQMPAHTHYRNRYDPYLYHDHHTETRLKDQGQKPFVININQAAQRNETFRTAIWTGKYLQVTLMSINPGEDVGLEVHTDHDQFLRIEAGQGFVQMGDHKDTLNFTRHVGDDDAIMVPAGTWHNLTNTGQTALKLYSIYAPPEHPFGTVHQTKADDPDTE